MCEIKRKSRLFRDGRYGSFSCVAVNATDPDVIIGPRLKNSQKTRYGDFLAKKHLIVRQ